MQVLSYIFNCFFCASTGLWNEIKFTDWVSAFGVLIGVPLTFVSIIKLFKKNEEHEVQIASFASMINSLERQASELQQQTKLLHDDVLLREKVAKGNVMPEFALLKEGSCLDKDGVFVKIINNGHKAYFSGISHMVNLENFEWENWVEIGKIIGPGETFNMFARYMSLDRELELHKDDLNRYDVIKMTAQAPSEMISFHINFSDILGNLYAYCIYRDEHALNSFQNLKMRHVQ